MKSIALSAAALCAMSTFSFGQQTNQLQRPDPAIAGGSAMPEHMKCAREDKAGNQFEIQIGQLAQQRSQTQQVRDLGMHISQDHQKAQQALLETCKSSDASSSSGAELNAVQQAKIDELQKKQGEEFDRCFVFGMVADHEHDLLTYRWQADHAPDPNVQKYAKDQIPVLESHLKMARAAAEMYVNEARQAAAHMKDTNSANNAASAGHDSHNFSSQPNNDGAGAAGGTGTDRTVHR
jgi:putative membrane protein